MRAMPIGNNPDAAAAAEDGDERATHRDEERSGVR